MLRATFEVPTSELTVTFEDIGDVTFEVSRDHSSAGLVGGRPVVYLDQNHWIDLARTLHAPHKATESVRDAADYLIRCARARAIVVPLSAAHMVETAKIDGAQRRHLAETMLRLSRGWIMRDVLAVRRLELRAMFRSVAVRPTAVVETTADVITLDPDAVFGDGRAVGDSQPLIGGLPPSMELLHRRLTSASAVFSVLAENEAEVSDEGLRRAAGWAQDHHSLAVHIASEPRARAHLRDLSRMKVITDLV